MKSISHASQATKCFALFSFFFFTLSLSAQNIWKGGTPGAETDWMQPRNWSQGQVPDWTDASVIIPDVSSRTRAFPVIKSTVPDISYLSIEGGAQVKIETTGSITIDGINTYNHGISNIGNLYNSGKLTIMNTAFTAFAAPESTIHNTGVMEIWDPQETERKPPVASNGKSN